MSLYGETCRIGGLPCGLVLRGGGNGSYQAVFEREYAALEEVEAISWDPPEIQGTCILPAGYGFTVEDIRYSSANRTFTVALQVGKQYLGDVTGYQAQVAELEGTITAQADTIQAQQSAIAQQESTIAQQAATIQTQQSTIDSQAAVIQELEGTETAAELESELADAYTEGVESNG